MEPKKFKNKLQVFKNKLGYKNTANSKIYFGKILNTIKFSNFKIYDNQLSGGLLNFWECFTNI